MSDDKKHDLQIGWVDRMAAGMAAAKTDQEVAEIRGFERPRRTWRGNCDVTQASRLRGAHARGKRKLALPVFGDGTDPGTDSED